MVYLFLSLFSLGVSTSAQALRYEAASDTQVKNAKCSRETPFSPQEMRDWLEKSGSPPDMKRVIKGISFEDESEENLHAFELLTLKMKNKSSACTQVECALKEIFSPATAVPLLFMQRRFGMNGSHLGNTQASAWKKSELDVVLLSLSDFPEGILPLAETTPLIHHKRGRISSVDSSVVANATMEVFDLWNARSPSGQRATLVHELGHVLGHMTELDQTDLWLKMSGWNVSHTAYSKGGTVISVYGESHPYEDFAESVAAYRYNPVVLRKASPAKYNIIKEAIFDNVEYTTEAACSAPRRLSARAKALVQTRVDVWQPSEAELKTISNKCNQKVFKQLSENETINLAAPFMNRCYEKAIHQFFTGLVKVELGKAPNGKFLAPLARNMGEFELSSEKTKSVVKNLISFHKKVLNEQILRAIDSSYFSSKDCGSETYKSAYGKFNRYTLDLKPRELKDELNAVVRQGCLNGNRKIPLVRNGL